MGEELDKSGKARKNNARQATEISPFYSLQQVLEIVPVSKTTLYLMIKNGEFPAQIKLSLRASVWSKDSVNKWVKAKLGA